jgi:phosphate-selective porin OprO and OprP
MNPLSSPPIAPARAIRKQPANAHRITGRGRFAENMKTKKTTTRPHPHTQSEQRSLQPSSTLVLTYRLPRTAVVVLLAAFQTQTKADDNPVARFGKDTYTELWSYATLYNDETNPLLQEFKLRGRYQGQYWDVDDGQGSQSDWDDRRSRLGFDAKFLDKKLEARADFQSNDGFEDIYDGLVDAYLRWKPSSSISITAGKTKPLIGQYDWLESTNTQPTFERSQIFNQLRINRATSLTIEGSSDEWSWRAGIYSNDTPSSTGGTGSFGDGEFGDLHGGFSQSLGVGYDFKQSLNLEKADFRIDWLHSDRDTTDDLVLNRYDDVISSTFWLKQGDAALVIEGYYASGGDGDDSDVFGFFIQPSYDIIPKTLQLVGRYSFATSEGPLGVMAQPRYERNVAGNDGRGDQYHAIYGGAQYFIHGDKLKLLAGAEWAHLENDTTTSYNGFTILTGLRLSF